MAGRGTGSSCLWHGPDERLFLSIYYKKYFCEVVASFRSRRSVSHGPRWMATASYESGAIRKMVGLHGSAGGGNARDRRVFWPMLLMHCPRMYQFSPTTSTGSNDLQNLQPVPR